MQLKRPGCRGSAKSAAGQQASLPAPGGRSVTERLGRRPLVRLFIQIEGFGTANAEQSLVTSWQGHCPICEQDTIFEAQNAWFRDYLHCRSCLGGSIPRERAIMQVLRESVPAIGNGKAFMRVRLAVAAPQWFWRAIAWATHPPTFIPMCRAADIERGCAARISSNRPLTTKVLISSSRRTLWNTSSIPIGLIEKSGGH